MGTADFKSDIFPLLFLKCICDVWEQIIDKTDDEPPSWFPESHRFQSPDDYH
ncbi:MAG TPA: hypothetical protein ACQGQH_08110 [Xylella sp.]